MRIAVLPGDGIGPEILASTIDVLKVIDNKLSLGLVFEYHEVGLTRLKRDGTTFPSSVLDACRSADGIILGPTSSSDYPPRSSGGINLSAELRVALDLYANIRPNRSREGIPHWGRSSMDLVIVRENTEGFYSDRNMYQGSGEFMPSSDIALSVRKISAMSSRRIAKMAFEIAMGRRRKVTAIHKVNVIKISDGLFLREVRRVAGEYPDVLYEEQLVDSMAALLIRDAQHFDVIVTTNMFGDILSDEAAELSGSLGLGGAINASNTHCMAQAQHGSAPDIQGRDRANPVSLILSASMLLEWYARKHQGPAFATAGNTIERAIDILLKNPTTRTMDLGGSLGTKAFTSALCAEIAQSHH